jgi:hypothetical protein
MKWFAILGLAIAIALTTLAALPFAPGHADDEAIFDGRIPAGYRDWRLISVAHEEGSLNDLRAVLGNDVAIKPLRRRLGCDHQNKLAGGLAGLDMPMHAACIRHWENAGHRHFQPAVENALGNV